MIYQFKKYIYFFFLTLLILVCMLPSIIFADDNGMYGGTGSLKGFPESGPKNVAFTIEAKGFHSEEEI